MSRHLLRQYTAALGAVALAAAGAVCAWRGQLGPAAMASLTVLCLTDTALRARRRHQRLLEEHQWARRRGAGENPAPLWPCCLLASSSRGRAHSHHCTAPSLAIAGSCAHRGPHPGFTCAEVDASQPYFRVRWDQEQQAGATTSDQPKEQ